MYSRNYSYNSLDTSSARDVAQSFANAKNAAGAKSDIPVKSFPDIGAYTHFEKDVGNGSLTPKDTRTPMRTQPPNAVDTQNTQSPAAVGNKSDISEKAPDADNVTKEAESAEDETPEVSESVAKRSEAVQTVSRSEEKSMGLAMRLKHGLEKYTGGLTSSIGIDDILLTALLVLFLTDGSEENDSLIPIILLALILF